MPHTCISLAVLGEDKSTTIFCLLLFVSRSPTIASNTGTSATPSCGNCASQFYEPPNLPLCWCGKPHDQYVDAANEDTLLSFTDPALFLSVDHYWARPSGGRIRQYKALSTPFIMRI